jgi:Tfp pilus assembly protein PilN
MRLTAREKLLLTMLLIAGLAAAFYNWVYIPQTTQISANAAEIGRLEAEHNKLLRWQAEVPQTEARLAAVQADLDGWVTEARAVSDTPLMLVFLQNQSQRYGVRLNSIRLAGKQASLSFTAPSYGQVRSLLMAMEKTLALEVVKATYNSPAGGTVDGTFDIRLQLGPANKDAAGVPVERTNPFVR